MEEKMTMVNPKIETLLEHSENKFTLVIEASKRARQITNFQKRLGQGVGGVAPMKLEDISRKPLSIALEEIAEGKIECDRPAEYEDGEEE
ncbi:MAG: DNA-directed RNA polymerase subunit omega [Candidatus Anoxymicrobium japonicum]|uniref:DNA-directed RNA polymerase subunit omega n=1 Tax=Candidatus Anoxymicrobium japonicum TaxID=2013648 RepID=A0A2N3G4J1_9ACTN|nr:MAG: DNA-directed RNA polymerase subunit omega [Candidatus Anoxymicrobium japonicum]